MYLWDINVAVAGAVTSVTLSALLFYLATTIAPVGVPFCPFKTPQSVYAKDVLDALVKHHTLPGKIAGVWKRKLREHFHQIRGARSTLPATISQNDDIERGVNQRPTVQNTPRRIWEVITKWLSPRGESSQQNVTSYQNQTPADAEESFVKGSLSWLIEHCQNSDSVDTAIGALAIGGVQLEDEDMEVRIIFHLVKSYSHCFVAISNGVELRLVQPNKKSQAFDYVRWMSHFAGNSTRKKAQILLVAKTLGTDMVTHLGVAFAR